jgi:hypothetical protein
MTAASARRATKALPLPTPRKLYAPDCPAKYTGPIEAAGGVRPFNNYLWPTKSWWLYHEPGMSRHSSRFHFGYIELADGVAQGGPFAVNGFLWHIEKNCRRYSWEATPDQLPRRNNFPTRNAAIRTAAADVLRLARSARHWKGIGIGADSLHDPARFAEVVNWVRAVVTRETGVNKPPRVMIARPLPPPPPPATGLGLLDVMIGAQ